MVQVSICYYAILREQRGLEQESIDTASINAAEIYKELKQKHSFTLTLEQLKVFINDEQVQWDAQLNDGDQVVFIPPVSGGG